MKLKIHQETNQENSIRETIDSLRSPKINVDKPLKNVSVMVEEDHRGFLDSPFSFENLKFCLSSTNIKSSPGINKIDYEIISSLPEFYLRNLLELYNYIFHYKVFPEDWKSYLVNFIPQGSTNKVRPTSTSFLGSLNNDLNGGAKRMVYMHNHKWDSERHFDIRYTKNFLQKYTLASLFLDIKGTDNDVIPEILIVLFCTNSEIIERTINKSLSQKSVSSNLLYAIYTRKLEKITDAFCNILQFTVDISIYNRETELSVEEKVRKLETNASKIVLFLRERGLEIDPEKCVLVIFHDSNYNYSKGIQISISNIPVNSSKYVKFLGMYLDRRLNWKKHSEYVTDKCTSAMKILSCLRRTWWGADSSALLHLYIALIRSRIEYGWFLLSPCSISDIKKLQRLQNTAIRIALIYRMSTPNYVMAAESKILYLNIRMKELECKYILKCLSNENNL
ncbi:hypothetical protein TSAR_011479, partial [Trichomalopsis sarcophagae]